MIRPASFNHQSLNVHVPIPVARFYRAHELLVTATPAPDLNENELWAALVDCMVVEHEYFHYRSFLSSTLGRFLFYVVNIPESRLYDLFALPSTRAFFSKRPYRQLIPTNLSEVDAKFLPPNLRPYVASRLFNRFVWQPSRSNYAQLQKFRSEPARSPLNLYGQDLGIFPYNESIAIGTNVMSPTEYELTLYASCIPLRSIIEGAAAWREYLYVSVLAWYRFNRHFQNITRAWIELTTDSHIYRVAADEILRATGCNMAMALPGVLLDIALSGPFCSDQPVPWSEAHPSLRFRKIIELAPAIPRHFRTQDNCDPVTDQYYSDLDELIAEKLGWRTVAENVTAMAADVRSRLATVEPYGPSTPNNLAEAIETRFGLAFQDRRAARSAYLFDWNNDRATRASPATSVRPLFTEFSDGVDIAQLDDKDFGVILRGAFSYCVLNVMRAFLAGPPERGFLVREGTSLFRKLNTMRMSEAHLFWDVLPNNRIYKKPFAEIVSKSLGFDVDLEALRRAAQ